MNHDDMIKKQAKILIKTFPELKEQTLDALNADGILWKSRETGKFYYVKDNQVIRINNTEE